MIKSREFKTVCKQFLITIGIVFLLSLVACFGNFKLYERNLKRTQASFIDAIVKENPEIEEDLIHALKENTGSEEEGLKLLEKYGIDDDTLASFQTQKDLKMRILLFHSMTFLGITLIVSLVYLLNMRSFYRKLGKINEYINDVLNDKVVFHMKEYEEGIFSTLNNDVYKITSKLREQNDNIIKDKKYLEETLSDISHQLKTPLTSMYMINNLLLDDKLDEKTKKEFLHKNELQLERIEWLVTSLLKLSRLESGMIKLKNEEVKVIDLIKAALEPLTIPIEIKKQKMIFKGNTKTKIICDFDWTKEALVNIIKNAHEHTKEGGMLEFVWQDNPLYVALIITDTGEGISKDDLAHIFERFYKGKSSHKDSIGIGLNMAKQIIDRQQGDISVRSIVGQGTEFTIKFYKHNI